MYETYRRPHFPFNIKLTARGVNSSFIQQTAMREEGFESDDHLDTCIKLSCHVLFHVLSHVLFHVLFHVVFHLLFHVFLQVS